MTVRTIVARMDDPDAEHPNPIHSTASAQSYGFAGALVGGVTIFSWAVPTIVETLGAGWLDDGWVDMAFRRPVYPEQELTVSVDDQDGSFEIATDAVCVRGVVGLGKADFLDALIPPRSFEVRPVATPLPHLTPDNVPVGRELAVLGVVHDTSDAAEYARTKAFTDDPRFAGDAALAHPGWLAEQPIRWLHHSYDYGPSIHARTRMQLHRVSRAAGEYLVAGRVHETYARNGHEYVVNHIVIRDAIDRVATIEHSVIYQVAKRSDDARST